LLALFGLLCAIAVKHPGIIDDRNVFLKEFFDVDLLSFQGLLSSIAIASAANIYLHINVLTDQTGLPFKRLRKSLKKSALSLVILLGVGLTLVIGKPLLPNTSTAAGLANAVGLSVIYMNISIMWDLTVTVFSIPSKSEIESEKQRMKNTGAGNS